MRSRYIDRVCSAKNESPLLHVCHGLCGVTVSDYRRSVSGVFHKQCLLPTVAPSARLCPMILYRLWKGGWCIWSAFFTHFRVPDILAGVNTQMFRSYCRMGVGFDFFRPATKTNSQMESVHNKTD